MGNYNNYIRPKCIAKLLDSQSLTMLVNKRVNLPSLPLALTRLNDRGVRPTVPNLVSAYPPWLHKERSQYSRFQPASNPIPGPRDFTILLNHRPESFTSHHN
ncbi:MAG: hypothetical protein LBV77_02550 [Candidatus Adiutrix intracellularis]|nr:hypothetical protein [Candidatus Adiutrix intracellularis]